jgi:hypothetical protein
LALRLQDYQARRQVRDQICAITRFDNSVLARFGLPRSLPA